MLELRIFHPQHAFLNPKTSQHSPHVSTLSRLAQAIQVDANTSLRLVFPSPRHSSFQASTLFGASAVDFCCAASPSLASSKRRLPPCDFAFRLLFPAPWRTKWPFKALRLRRLPSTFFWGSSKDLMRCICHGPRRPGDGREEDGLEEVVPKRRQDKPGSPRRAEESPRRVAPTASCDPETPLRPLDSFTTPSRCEHRAPAKVYVSALESQKEAATVRASFPSAWQLGGSENLLGAPSLCAFEASKRSFGGRPAAKLIRSATGRWASSSLSSKSRKGRTSGARHATKTSSCLSQHHGHILI